jgi:hypothetical protein
MLWRESYATRILRDVACPVVQMVNLDGSQEFPEVCIWIGGFGFQALADQGVWWRLFQSDFPNDPLVRKVFIVERVSSQETAMADSLVPGSEASRCTLGEDANGFWKNLVQPDQENRGFAALIVGNQIPLLMVGPPTEEAWEEFSEAWRTKSRQI